MEAKSTPAKLDQEDHDPIFGYGVELAINSTPQPARSRRLRICPGFERYPGKVDITNNEVEEESMEREHNGITTVYTVQVTPSDRMKPKEDVEPMAHARQIGERVLYLPEPESPDGIVVNRNAKAYVVANHEPVVEEITDEYLSQYEGV